MKKWVWFVVGIVLIAVLVGMGYLYQYAGGRYYLAAVGYMRTQPKPWTTLYGDMNKQRYGGVLAGVTNKGVWIWGQYGPRYFKVADTTQYLLQMGCVEQREEAIKYSSPKSLDEWGGYMRVGDSVGVRYREGSKEILQLAGADFWVFVNRDLATQCKREGGV